MKTAEIIHLRLSGQSLQNLVDIIRACIGAEREGMEVLIYHNIKVKGDLAVHLNRDTAAGDEGPSNVGIRLAAMLKDYGMVAHSVWTECCQLPKDQDLDETRTKKQGGKA